MGKRTRGQQIFAVFNALLMVLIIITCLLPLINVLAVSFSRQEAVAAGAGSLLPVGFTTVAYTTILKDRLFLRTFGNSLLRLLAGVPINLFLAITAAYPLSKNGNKLAFRQGYVWFFVTTMLVGGGLIPTYLTIRALGLLGSFWALILPGAVSAYNMILLLNFFKTIPSELEEAALIDGAGHWRILWGLYVPCSLPAIATLTLFFVVGHWNEWFSAQIYLNRTEQYPLQSYLQVLLTQSKNTQNLSLKELEELAKVNNRTFNSAQIVLSTLPVLLVYPFLQRYFVTGLTLGSVKG